ncbi:transposase, partial [uncultured Lamprocystis sp.]|uniref:transposase n=1 Tax=uncultured Lamprocystis sp. TaxID=543132 RepID=UPI0025E745AE
MKRNHATMNGARWQPMWLARRAVCGCRALMRCRAARHPSPSTALTKNPQGFINAAKEVFGRKVRIVADRFHVAKLYRDGLEDLRKKELRRLKRELPAATY